MLWAQRVKFSLHSICAPTAIRAARLLRPRFSSCFAPYPGICSPALLTGLPCRNIALGRHRFGQLSMVRRAKSEQNTDALSKDYNAIDSESSTQPPYRVVNFYHLVDIKNPYQVRCISSCLKCIASCTQRNLSVQVIAEHKLWVEDKGLAGRIYLSSQGINAQYSGVTAHAEGYAMWLQEQEQFKVTTPDA